MSLFTNDVIDLSEYKSPEDAVKLISGPEGEMGELIREFELHPFSVIYFENEKLDELDKDDEWRNEARHEIYVVGGYGWGSMHGGSR